MNEFTYCFCLLIHITNCFPLQAIVEATNCRCSMKNFAESFRKQKNTKFSFYQSFRHRSTSFLKKRSIGSVLLGILCKVLERLYQRAPVKDRFCNSNENSQQILADDNFRILLKSLANQLANYQCLIFKTRLKI